MKYLLSAFMAIACLPLISQNKPLPKWVTTPPQSTASEQKVVSSGNSIQEARHNAINLLIGMTNINKEEKSYQKRLLDSGREPISQHQSLVSAAENSQYFKTLNSCEHDGEFWVLCSMNVKDLATFSDSLYNAILSDTYLNIKRARNLKQIGDLYGSATTYSEALRNIVPMLHKELTCEEGDLVDILHNEYVTCLDNIDLKIDYSNCPFVQGEEVPLDILVTASYKDMPVSALPLTFKISDDGKVKEQGKTDGKGRAKTRILSAPTKDTGKLAVYTDLTSLSSTLPQTIFSMELTQHLALEPKQATMTLTAFDPTPTYSVEFKEKGIECVSDSINALMKRGGNKLVEKGTDEDLLISVDLTATPDGDVSTGKYAMQYYLCGMTLTLTDRRTMNEIVKVEKSGFRIFLRAGSEEEQIKSFAASELYKRLKNQLKKIQDYRFDKRKVVYSEIN